MSARIHADDHRSVVPRWRDPLTSSATGELATLSTETVLEHPTEDFLLSKLRSWRKEKTIAFACDLIGAAFVLGRHAEAVDAALFLLAHSWRVPKPVLIVAAEVVGQTAPTVPKEETDRVRISAAGHREAIHEIRRRLHDEPRNAVLWVSIARRYAIVGEASRALEAMERALWLAPSNRYVLRCAARLFAHADSPDRAVAALRRTDATKSDPWLMAAEIAVSTIAERTSPLIKTGRGVLKAQRFLPRETNELASALATVDLLSGNTKDARRLFTEALIQPTDNTVAQAEWASRRMAHFHVQPRHLKTPLSFEARAWENFSRGDWKNAIGECIRWLDDEPFSRRAPAFGSFIASVALADYGQAEDIARWGLMANPDDQTLLNNLTFSLASAGKLDEAARVHQRMDPDKCDSDTKIAWTATGGLLRYRLGFPEEGRQLYLRAIELASGPVQREFRAMAAAFLTREELRIGRPGAQEYLAMFLKEAKNIKGEEGMREILIALQRMLRLVSDPSGHK